jgi:branched-chain amino acid transport system substrate-binding protein
MTTTQRTPVRTMATALVATALLTGCALRVDHDKVVAASGGGATTVTDGAALPGQVPGTVTQPGVTDTGTVPAPGAVSQPGAVATTAPQGTPGAGGTKATNPSRPAAAGAGTTSVCKGTGTIKLGNVAPYGASAVGQNFAPGRDVLKVWERDVNARGGICGRPVQVIIKDDQGNASNTSAALRDLVENEKVSAIVAWGTALTLNAGLGYLESKGIPVLGGDNLSLKWSTSPVLFPIGAGYDESIGAALTAAKRPGAANKASFLYCAEAQACSDAYDIMVNKGVAQKVGTPMVYTAKVSLTAISFASECQQAAKAGADILFIGGDASFVDRVANSCAQQGLKFRYTTLSLAVTDAQSQNPNLQGNFAVGTPVIPWPSTSSPGAKLYQEAIARYSPSTVNSGIAIQWWTAAKLAETVIGRIGAGDVTPASIAAAARTLKNETLGGLTGPMTYTAGGQGSFRCYGVAEVQNNKWVGRDNGKIYCRTGDPLTPEGADTSNSGSAATVPSAVTRTAGATRSGRRR